MSGECNLFQRAKLNELISTRLSDEESIAEVIERWNEAVR